VLPDAEALLLEFDEPLPELALVPVLLPLSVLVPAPALPVPLFEPLPVFPAPPLALVPVFLPPLLSPLELVRPASLDVPVCPEAPPLIVALASMNPAPDAPAFAVVLPAAPP